MRPLILPLQRGDEVVAFDRLGAGTGAIIGLSEGREAANPFGKQKTPVDAYCACLIDSGMPVRDAVRAAIVEPLTDDVDVKLALTEVAQSVIV